MSDTKFAFASDVSEMYHEFKVISPKKNHLIFRFRHVLFSCHAMYKVSTVFLQKSQSYAALNCGPHSITDEQKPALSRLFWAIPAIFSHSWHPEHSFVPDVVHAWCMCMSFRNNIINNMPNHCHFISFISLSTQFSINFFVVAWFNGDHSVSFLQILISVRRPLIVQIPPVSFQILLFLSIMKYFLHG